MDDLCIVKLVFGGSKSLERGYLKKVSGNTCITYDTNAIFSSPLLTATWLIHLTDHEIF
jgi:hypothetical protein